MMTDSPSKLGGDVNPSSPSATPGRSQPLSLPPLKHRFDTHVWIQADKSISGRPQTERTCTTCGAVKVTLHGADTGRAWRANEGAPQVETFDAPVCVPKAAPPT